MKNKWNEIVEKSQIDENFRENLIKNAKETIEKEFGIKLPKSITIKVHQQTPEVLHLTLPRQLPQMPEDNVTNNISYDVSSSQFKVTYACGEKSVYASGELAMHSK